MSITKLVYKPIARFKNSVKNSLEYGASAAQKLEASRGKSMGTIERTRVKLESVRRNNPEIFYPVAGFCSGVPGGTSAGIVLGFFMKLFKK